MFHQSIFSFLYVNIPVCSFTYLVHSQGFVLAGGGELIRDTHAEIIANRSS